MIEAIENLQFFTAIFFDGSIQRCFELEELLWQVRLAHDRENSARPHIPAHVPLKPKLLTTLDLADLGL